MPKGIYVRSPEFRERLKQLAQPLNYKGDKVGYKGVHQWLIKVYSNPPKCEICGKLGERIKFKWNIDWALIKGKNYERKRENFWGLCHLCHMRYDDTGKLSRGVPRPQYIKDAVSKANKGRPAWNKGLKIINKTHK